ncbi:DUF2474 family protein [uncultured Jannaschia sp.]|nr:DUF2474 family protein [uncultured Jannaschia sp.]
MSPRLRKVMWFVAIWAASVLLLGFVAGMIRLAIA